jgi:hypothetical protein
VLPDGSRDILGLWIEGTEGAKFWMKVFNDLKTRGIGDIRRKRRPPPWTDGRLPPIPSWKTPQTLRTY